MSAQKRPITTKPPTSGERVRRGFGIEINGRVYPLGTGTFLIGRAANVDFRLDEGLVSRQHAALDVSDDGVVVRDLASRNGVVVNGRRLRGSGPLRVGDVLTLGSAELRLVARNDASGKRPVVPTRAGQTEPPAPADFDEPDAQQLTRQADPLELLSSIVDRALEQGNAEEAESLVSGHLLVLLNAARTHRQLQPETCARASDYALKLARSTGKQRWVDYVFELHTTARRPMPLRLVHELHSLLPIARVSSRPIVDDYARMLESLSSRDAGPERAFILQRLSQLLG